MPSGSVLQVKLSLCTTASDEAHVLMRCDGSGSFTSDTDTDPGLDLNPLRNRVKVLGQNNVSAVLFESCLKEQVIDQWKRGIQ